MKIKMNETRPASILHLKQQIRQRIQVTHNDFQESVMTFLWGQM